MPWWLKICLGTIGTIAIIFLTPIEELMLSFAWLVVIPMTFLLSLGFVTEGTFEAVTNFIPNIFEDLRTRIEYHLEAKRGAEG